MWVAVLIFCAGRTGQVVAQNASAPAEEKSASGDVTKATDLFRQGKMLDALPLYESLALKFPTEASYQERLGVCLLAKSATVSDPAERRTLLKRAHQHGTNAQNLGDHSDYVDILMKIDPDHPTDVSSLDPGEAGRLLKEGEAAFSRGDFPAAFKAYSKAAETNPHLYEAALFTGDTAFQQHDAAAAGEWFAEAIAIDPDRETAYRYWGDTLEQAGKGQEARAKFVDAVVAEPYNQIAWSGLVQWSHHHKVSLQAPEIKRPGAPTVDPATGDSTVEPAKNIPADSVWNNYLQTKAKWRSETFAKTYPDTAYRHTLREETEALHAVVLAVEQAKTPLDKLDSSTASLVAVDEAGMLEPWILITGADGAIARDYRPYRAAHRELLRAYVEQYIVHDKSNFTPH